MNGNALDTAMAGIRAIWGPLTSEVIAGCQYHLERLLRAPATEEWLAALHRDAPASRELYRDPVHGFVLLAHTERDLKKEDHDGHRVTRYVERDGAWTEGAAA